VGSIIFLCVLLHLLSRCWGKVFFLWGNDIAVLTFPPGNGVSLRRKCCSRGRMSWKTPQFQEEMPCREENVLENTPKPGETAAAEGKCPWKRHKTRRNRSRRAQREHRCNKKRPPIGKAFRICTAAVN
jgi:hypothetical protein